MKKIEDNESLINNENPMSPFSFNNEDNPDLIEIKKLKNKKLLKSILNNFFNNIIYNTFYFNNYLIIILLFHFKKTNYRS